MNQGDMELGRQVANTHTNQTLGAFSMLKVRGTSEDSYIQMDASSSKGELKIVGATDLGQVIIDTAEAHGLQLRLRQVEVCVNGVTKYAIALISEPQNSPIQ